MALISTSQSINQKYRCCITAKNKKTSNINDVKEQFLYGNNHVNLLIGWIQKKKFQYKKMVFNKYM